MQFHTAFSQISLKRHENFLKHAEKKIEIFFKTPPHFSLFIEFNFVCTAF